MPWTLDSSRGCLHNAGALGVCYPAHRVHTCADVDTDNECDHARKTAYVLDVRVQVSAFHVSPSVRVYSRLFAPDPSRTAMVVETLPS